MKLLVLLLLVSVSISFQAQDLYFPPTSGNVWETLQAIDRETSQIIAPQAVID